MNKLADIRAQLDRAVIELEAADLADAIGMLAATQARLLARMVTPIVASAPGELVTAEAVAERFHLTVSTVHELARQGRLPCRMAGRFRRFDLAEVAAAMGDSKSVSLAPGHRTEKAA